ncbi:MAG: hypothetical protein AAF798_15105, partial [Bacteroidota bacterium]
MENTRPHRRYHSYCLHTAAQQRLVQDLQAHIKHAAREVTIGGLVAKPIESIKSEVFLNRMKESNTLAILCLVSHELLTSKLSFTNFWEQLVVAHRCKRILVVPIVVDDCSRVGTPLERLALLDANQVPLAELSTTAYQSSLAKIARAVVELLRQQRDRRLQIDGDWEAAQEAHTAFAYEAFNAKHRWSKYAAMAKRRQVELEEEKLWKEAEAFGAVPKYVEYLKRIAAPKHQEVAVQKIIAIEQAPNLSEEAIQEMVNIGELFDFKRKAIDAQTKTQINDRFYQLLSQPLEQWVRDEAVVQSEVNYLHFQLHQECGPSELYTFYGIEKFAFHLADRLEGLKRKAAKRKADLISYLMLALLSLLLV